MADDFTYNGVAIQTPLVSIISAEPIYDDSDANVMFTRIKLRVQGTIQGAPAAGDTPGTFAATLTAARKALLVPRASLSVSMADQTLVSLGSGDDQNGPIPRRLDATEIVGAMFAIVVFEIDLSIQEKCSTPSNIISHTYSVTHALDSTYYTTRTLRGKVRVRQSASGNNPDALRGLIVPALPSGFKRDRMDFAVSEDGLELRYEITDKEVYRVAPVDAVEATGRFSAQMNNFVWFNHLNVELRGHKQQTKLAMYNAAFAVAASRMDFSKEIIRQASIEEELYENVVRLSIVTQCTSVNGNANGIFPTNTKIFTDVPGNAANNTTQLSAYGSALLMAAKKAFYDPCGTDAMRYAQTTGPTGTSGDTTGSTQIDSSGVASDSPTSLSSDQNEGAYTHWEQTIDFYQDNGLAMLPASAASTAAKVYQLYNPMTVIVQQGQAVRSGKPVNVPVAQQVANGYVASKQVRHGAPQLFPDKTTYCYAAAWRYTILVPANTSDFASSGSGSGSPTLIDVPLQNTQIPSNGATTFDPYSASVGIDVGIMVNGHSVGGS